MWLDPSANRCLRAIGVVLDNATQNNQTRKELDEAGLIHRCRIEFGRKLESPSARPRVGLLVDGT